MSLSGTEIRPRYYRRSAAGMDQPMRTNLTAFGACIAAALWGYLWEDF